MAITITDEFQDALNRINAGENVLITGKAGTGKFDAPPDFSR